MTLLRRWWWLLCAPLLSVYLFREAYNTWFLRDDFAWLGLGLSVSDLPTLLDALFGPKAQGTVRPLSDRLPFLLGHALFGLDARPFRIFVFAFHGLNLTLLALLVHRWTNSRLAATVAAIAWTAHSALAQPLSWSSSMNQILWPSCLLSALWARENSRPLREWCFFLTGFGVLELNVVYPVLALALQPSRWRSTLPLFATSTLYALANRTLVPPQANPVYALDFHPLSILKTTWTYLQLSMGSYGLDFDAKLANFLLVCTLLGAAGLLAALLLDRDRLLAFGFVWYLVCLGPVLLLSRHISDYYVATPAAGVGIAFGIAFARRPKLLALPLVAYLAGSITVSQEITHYNRQVSQVARRLVRGVEQAAALHPGKLILLAGVTSEQFWNIINDSPFRLLPGVKVYLVPDSEKGIAANPNYGNPVNFILPLPAARQALADDSALVYAAGNSPLRNITNRYKLLARDEWADVLADNLDVGQPLLSTQLGPGWEPIDQGFRWMRPEAEVTLGGTGNAIAVECFRAENENRPDLVTLELSSGSTRIGSFSIPRRGIFRGRLPLPPNLASLPRLPLHLKVTPPILSPSDQRTLGLAFGRISRATLVP